MMEAIRGRGTAGNPGNRFEPLHYEADPEVDPSEVPAPATRFYRDHSRSIIARNDSPDVGFSASINPYRGCEHGCVYCMCGDTPILMADGSTKRLDDVVVGDEIYGTAREGWYRRYVRTRVLAHWRTLKNAYRIMLADGTRLVSSGDHRFLTERGWKFVTGAEQGADRRPHLTCGNTLMGTGSFGEAPAANREYSAGYLCGMIRGDALLASYTYSRAGRTHGDQWQFRLALVDRDALLRTRQLLAESGIPTHEFVFSKGDGPRREIPGIRTHAAASVKRIQEIVELPGEPSQDWFKGFLAGIFDAEGCYSDGCLRITNSNPLIISAIVSALQELGFRHVVEERTREKVIYVVRVCGGLREHLRFFHTVRPAIGRKQKIEGQAIKNDADLRIVSIEPMGVVMPMVDITTGTGDFIANGVVSHNCYARPTHEYLGMSAGLDFETKILVKENAPELLRAELGSPKWIPEPLGLSGVTDCYQPIERKLQLTRRCLEVLCEFRNPVTVITKNALVTRDIDLLGELAGHSAAGVALSITSLDRNLQRVLEPRTSTPENRLAAVRALADAGIPTSVMIAPVIPGLNDHEIPGILEAAAEAGACGAAYVALRLPYAVKVLFEEWLEQHRPLAKEKVLNAVRSMRGGRLNDPRFKSRMVGEGLVAERIRRLFEISKRKAGLDGPRRKLSVEAFRRPSEQLQFGEFSV